MSQKSIFVQGSPDYMTSNTKKNKFEANDYKIAPNYHTNSHDASIIVAETEIYDTQRFKFNADNTANYSPPHKKLIVESQDVISSSPPLFDNSTEEIKHEYNLSSSNIMSTNNLSSKTSTNNKNITVSESKNIHASEKAVFSNSEPNYISDHLKLQFLKAHDNNFDSMNDIDNTQYVDNETSMDFSKNSQFILTNSQNKLSHIINHESQRDQSHTVAKTIIPATSLNRVDQHATKPRKQLRAKKRRGQLKSDRLSFSQKVTKKVLKKYATHQNSQTGAATISEGVHSKFSSVLERLYNDTKGARTSFRFKEYRDSNVTAPINGKKKGASASKSGIVKRSTRTNKQKTASKTLEVTRIKGITPETSNKEPVVVPLIITSTNSSDAFKQPSTSSKTKTLAVPGTVNAQVNGYGLGDGALNSALQSNRFLTYNPTGFNPSTSASPVSMQGVAWDREVKDFYAFVTYYTITKRWLGNEMIEKIKENEVVQQPCLINSLEVKGLNYTPAGNIVGRVVELPSSESRLADVSSSVKTADDIQGYKLITIQPSPTLCSNNSAVEQINGRDDDTVNNAVKQTSLFKTPLKLGNKLLSVQAQQRATLGKCCAALKVKASASQMRLLQQIIYGDGQELAQSNVHMSNMIRGSTIIESDSNSAVPETMDECILKELVPKNDLSINAKTKSRVSSPRLIMEKLPTSATISIMKSGVASVLENDTMVNANAAETVLDASKLKLSKQGSVIEILDKLKIDKVWARWGKDLHYPGKIVGTIKRSGKGKKFKVKFEDGDFAVCDACDILLTKTLTYNKSIVNNVCDIEFPDHTPVLANLSTRLGAQKKQVWYEDCLIINENSEKTNVANSCVCVRRKDDQENDKIHNISLDHLVLSEQAMAHAGIDTSFLPKLSELLKHLSEYNENNETTSNSLSAESHANIDTDTVDNELDQIYRTPTKAKSRSQSTATSPHACKNETGNKSGKGKWGVDTSPSKAIAKSNTETGNFAVLGPLLPKGSQIFKDILFLLTHKRGGNEKCQNSGSYVKSPSIKRETRSKVKLNSSSSNEALHSTDSNSSSSLNSYPTTEFNKQHLIDQIQSGNGMVLETFDDCLLTSNPNRRVICVADSYSRTEKYLKCLAADFPCISHLYIIECCKQNKLLEYENFTLPAGKSILKNCSMLRKKIGNIFRAIKVTFVPANPRSLATDEKLCLSLLQSMGCQVNVSKLISDPKPDVVVAVYKNEALSNKAREHKIALVCIEWVIQSLIHAELLPYYAHESFYNF